MSNTKSLGFKSISNFLDLEISDSFISRLISVFLWVIGCYMITYHAVDFTEYKSLIALLVAFSVAGFIFAFDSRAVSIRGETYGNRLSVGFSGLVPRAIMSLLLSLFLTTAILMILFDFNLVEVVRLSGVSNKYSALVIFLKKEPYLRFFALLLGILILAFDFAGSYFDKLQQNKQPATLRNIGKKTFSKNAIPLLGVSLLWALTGFFVTHQLIVPHPNAYLISFITGLVFSVFIVVFDLRGGAILIERSYVETPYSYKILVPRVLMSILVSILLTMALLMVLFSRDLSIILSSEIGLNRISALGQYIQNQSYTIKILALTSPSLFLGYDYLTYRDKYFSRPVQKVVQQQKEIIKSQEEELKISNEQQIQIIASIQHELGNKLPAAKNYFADLVRGLEYASEKSQNFTLQGKVREMLPGELKDEVDSVQDIIKKIEAGLTYSISIVDNIGGIVSADPSRFKPEKKSLLAFIKEYSKGYPSHANFRIEVAGDDVLIDFDAKQIGVLLNNIIANAMRHSFVDNDKSYLLLFELRAISDQVELYVRNDGAPFEESFSMEDYLTANKFAGKNGNSGIGGYLIGLVLKNHKGSIELVDPSINDEFNVNLKISLPINH